MSSSCPSIETPVTPEPGSRLTLPLEAFYRRSGLPLPVLSPVEGVAVPRPYRDLLVHQRDMTPTLESFHGERIVLRLLGKHVGADRLDREVVLTLEASGRAVEFGAIAIHLQAFPEAARAEIAGCRTPLGTILTKHGVQHLSRPDAFFSLESDSAIEAVLEMRAPARLYGRHNFLTTPDGRLLADVLEILPPVD